MGRESMRWLPTVLGTLASSLKYRRLRVARYIGWRMVVISVRASPLTALLERVLATERLRVSSPGLGC